MSKPRVIFTPAGEFYRASLPGRSQCSVFVSDKNEKAALEKLVVFGVNKPIVNRRPKDEDTP